MAAAASGFAIGVAAAPTSGTPPIALAITVDCGGKTPKGAIVLLTRGDTLGTAVDGALISAGVTDGTNHRCASCMAEDGQAAASTDTGHEGDNVGVVAQILATTSEAVSAEATFVSFAADTVNVTLTAAAPTGSLLVVIALYGDDCSVAVGSVTTSTTQGADVTVSGLAFRPRLGFTLSRQNGFGTAGAADARIHIGVFAVNEDGTVAGNCAVNYGSDDRPSTTATTTVLQDNGICSRLTVSTAGVGQGSENKIQSGTSDGFLVRTVGPATPSSMVLGYLVARFGTRRTWAGKPAALDATASGVQSFNDPAFPVGSLVAIGASHAAILDYALKDAAFSVGAASQVGDDDCASFQDENGASTGDSRSLTSGSLIHVLTNAGADDWVAGISGFTQTGFDLNVTTAAGTARAAFFLALERPLFEAGWLATLRRWRRRLGRM